MTDFQRIPVIDIAAPESAAEIGRACETAGFFYVTGHGVPANVVDGVFAAARWFFDRPLPEREALDVAGRPASAAMCRSASPAPACRAGCWRHSR